MSERLELQERLLNGEYWLGEGNGKTIVARLAELAVQETQETGDGN